MVAIHIFTATSLAARTENERQTDAHSLTHSLTNSIAAFLFSHSILPFIAELTVCRAHYLSMRERKRKKAFKNKLV